MKLNNPSKILWDRKSLPFILKALGMKIDYEGVIRDVESDSFVRDVNNNVVEAKNLIGIIKNKFITKESQLLNHKLFFND